MPVSVRNSRLTLIAGQCFFEHQWQFGPSPMLWEWAEYKWLFNQLRGGSADAEFDFAWRRTESAFWTGLLGGQKPAGAGPSAAWDAMVPFRITGTDRPTIATDDPAERAFYDIYGYPHGLVAALTIQSPRTSAELLDDWRDRTRRLRLNAAYTLTMPGGQTTSLKAGAALDALLDWHRLEHYGHVNEIYRSAEPFTIGVVIQADGVVATVPPTAALQRTLHAVTAWPANWQTVALSPLANHCLPVRSSTASAGDALYAATRGLTLWRPGLFTQAAASKAERIHTLSCLGHNLVAGAVQAESLRLFAQGFETSKPAQTKLDPDFATTAASVLDRLRRGEKTYRSSGIKHLIEDPNSKAEVNGLFTRKGHPPF